MSKKKAESAEKTETWKIRNDKGVILAYAFKIYNKYEDPFEGELTREAMSAIKELYTNEGAKLTQWQTYNQLADIFNIYSFHQFQQIIRAFKITKADSAFADHEIEECSNEDLSERLFRIKKTAHIRKVDANRQRDTEKLVSDLQKENFELQAKLDTLRDIANEVNLSIGNPWEPVSVNSEQSLIVWLSDMHIGCKVDDTSLYSNPYDANEVTRRLKLIYNRICELHKVYGGFKRLIVCNLGDSLDGQDMQTSRRDHLLPQNMNNKEQITTFISTVSDFMFNLTSLRCESLEYYAVGSSNHGGDYEWSAQKLLQAQLKGIGINATVFDKFIGGFEVNKVAFICSHGKDDKDMKKPFPVTINDKTENFINQYIRDYDIRNDKIMFVKGDSHQSATTTAKNFIYKSVGCFIGNTKWSSINFGNTPAVCEYSLVDTTSKIMNGIVYLK